MSRTTIQIEQGAKQRDLIAALKVLQGLGLKQASVLAAYAEPNHAAVAVAKKEYSTDDIEIDAKPLISESDEGCWVSAWVHVNKADYMPDQESQS